MKQFTWANGYSVRYAKFSLLRNIRTVAILIKKPRGTTKLLWWDYEESALCQAVYQIKNVFICLPCCWGLTMRGNITFSKPINFQKDTINQPHWERRRDVSAEYIHVHMILTTAITEPEKCEAQSGISVWGRTYFTIASIWVVILFLATQPWVPHSWYPQKSSELFIKFKLKLWTIEPPNIVAEIK